MVDGRYAKKGALKLVINAKLKIRLYIKEKKSKIVIHLFEAFSDPHLVHVGLTKTRTLTK